jgi:uncharacterized membrane protein YkvA (DUF1232 family)
VREPDVEAVEGEVAGEMPRRGAKKTLAHYIRQLPNYLRLLVGLMTDRRVSGLDKLLVAGALAYIVMPIDLVPDFIPFLGEVDDVYLLVLALQRLISNSGRSVVLAHWSGAPDDLAELNLRSVIAASILQRHGFTRAMDLEGGFNGWNAAQLPVERPASRLEVNVPA